MRSARHTLLASLMLSSASASAQHVWFDSPKRGVGYALGAAVQEAHLQRLGTLDPAWFYAWADEPRSGFDALPDGIGFIPMAWGRGGLTGAPPNKIDTWIGGRDAGLYDTLLGFNEPDLASQSNISVTEALDLWPLLESTGLRLVSPAVAGNSGTWLPEFMQGVADRGLRVDAIAVHRYGPPNAQAFLDLLDSIHATYGLPIWITEFAIRDGDATTPTENRFTDEEAYDFMAAVLPELESRPYVERYAWFPSPRDNPFVTCSALFEPDGTITPLGRLYTGQLQLSNPGFEAPVIDPPATQASNADHWVTINSAGLRTTHARTGAQSIRIAPGLSAGQSQPGIARQHFPAGALVHPGRRYSLGAWVSHRADDPLTGTREGSIRIQWFDAAGTLLDQMIEPAIDATTPTDTWRFVSLDEILIPDNGDIAEVRATLWVNNVGPSSVNSGAAYFDDVLFVEGALQTDVTCVCETDGEDAQVDVSDLLAYLADWVVGDPSADLDGSGLAEVLDLLTFLTCWFTATDTGC